MGENTSIKLDPLYVVRVRCEHEHTYETEVLVDNPKKKGDKITQKVTRTEYLARLWVIWRIPGATRHALACTNDSGYLVPCDVDGLPIPSAAVSLPVGKPIEFTFVRHPRSDVARGIFDRIKSAPGEFDPPTKLQVVKQVTGKDASGSPVEEGLLLVPESDTVFWPKGPPLYGEWLLYRRMPNSRCAPVRKQVERLQRHFGAMRFLVGNAHQPYRPPPSAIGDFDVMCWNSVLMFQDYAAKGSIAFLLAPDRTRLYAPAFPFEPTAASTSEDPKSSATALDRRESELYRDAIHGMYSGIDEVKELDRGVVSVETGKHLEHWLANDARKPDHILVCLHPPSPNWVHQAVARQVRNWSAELEAAGFPPSVTKPGKAGGKTVTQRARGVSLANGFRDIRYMTTTGGGAVDTSLHKVGIAFDLWMGTEIGGTQDDPDAPNYYPIYAVRSQKLGPSGKLEYSWTIWGEIDVGLVKPGGAVIEEGPKPPPPEFLEQLQVIYPHKYDPNRADGGAETVKANTGKRYVNISRIANHFGIYNIGPHEKGWQGGANESFRLTDPNQFAQLVERLEQQVFFKENFDPKAIYYANRTQYDEPGSGFALSDKSVQAEATFLRAWYRATLGQPASVDVQFESGAHPEKNALWNRMRAVTAAARFHVTIFEPITGTVDVRDDVALATLKLAPARTVKVVAKVFDPVVGKNVPFLRFACPAFKGKANHLEWWHFQVNRLENRQIGGPNAPLWRDLVREIGIAEDTIAELYSQKAFKKQAALVESEGGGNET